MNLSSLVITLKPNTDIASISEQISKYASIEVKEGDKIVTSNISDKYLPGLLIGYITSIESDSNNLTHSGTLTPAVDFEHMDEVLIILDLKQKTENEE